jgi:hypothetical protein
LKVTIHNHYSGVVKVLEGLESTVKQELMRFFPWLRASNPERQLNLRDMVHRLNKAQVYSARAEGLLSQPMAKAEPRNLTGDNTHVLEAMLGHHHQLHTALTAARFLAGGPEKTVQDARKHLWEADGDVEEAALACHGLEVSPFNVKALRAIQAISEVRKAQPDPLEPMEVHPGHPDAAEAAEQVDRAFKDRFVLPVQLGGKHSQGSMLARDQDSGVTWLLKPGS